MTRGRVFLAILVLAITVPVMAGVNSSIRVDAGDHFQGKAEDIQDAAADCPVEVIQFE